MTKKRHTIPAAQPRRATQNQPFGWRINPEDGEAERNATAAWVRNVVGRIGTNSAS